VHRDQAVPSRVSAFPIDLALARLKRGPLLIPTGLLQIDGESRFKAVKADHELPHLILPCSS